MILLIRVERGRNIPVFKMVYKKKLRDKKIEERCEKA